MAASAVATASYTINNPSVTALSNNAPQNWSYSSTSAQKIYSFQVASDVTQENLISGTYAMEIELTSGGLGSCDIYVKRGNAPTTGNYDFRIYGPGVSKKVLIDIDGRRSFEGGAFNGNAATGVRGDVWYIMLHGQSAVLSTNVTLKARADSVSISRRSSGGIASRSTWLLIHGKQQLGTTNAGTNTFALSSDALENQSTSDQVLLVDWSSGAASIAPDLSPGRFFIPVAKKTKSLLAVKGLNSSASLSVLGHSWGTLVGHEIALQYGTGSKISRFVAIDPAQEAFGFEHSSINFAARASSSWSFVAIQGVFGDEAKALTAHRACAVRFDPVSSLVPLQKDNATHGAVLKMYERVLVECYGNLAPPDKVSNELKMAVTGQTPSWTMNRFERNGTYLSSSDQTNRFEAYLSCRLNDTNGSFASLQLADFFF